MVRSVRDRNRVKSSTQSTQRRSNTELSALSSQLSAVSIQLAGPSEASSEEPTAENREQQRRRRYGYCSLGSTSGFWPAAGSHQPRVRGRVRPIWRRGSD